MARSELTVLMVVILFLEASHQLVAVEVERITEQSQLRVITAVRAAVAQRKPHLHLEVMEHQAKEITEVLVELMQHQPVAAVVEAALVQQAQTAHQALLETVEMVPHRLFLDHLLLTPEAVVGHSITIIQQKVLVEQVVAARLVYLEQLTQAAAVERLLMSV